MQQRQLRLGDILDDYCPRERRLTNHAVVAMVGPEVKRTRCTTCDTEHEYKAARMPRQRRRAEAAQPFAPGTAAGVPKRVPPLPTAVMSDGPVEVEPPLSGMAVRDAFAEPRAASAPDENTNGEGSDIERETGNDGEDGPVHRPLIRATLPRIEGQPPPTRPASEFTIRQPIGRGNRFRPRHQRAEQPFHGQRSSGGGGPMRSGSRQNTGRGPLAPHTSNPRGPGRRRSK